MDRAEPLVGIRSPAPPGKGKWAGLARERSLERSGAFGPPVGGATFRTDRPMEPLLASMPAAAAAGGKEDDLRLPMLAGARALSPETQPLIMRTPRALQPTPPGSMARKHGSKSWKGRSTVPQIV